MKLLTDCMILIINIIKMESSIERYDVVLFEKQNKILNSFLIKTDALTFAEKNRNEQLFDNVMVIPIYSKK